MGKIEEKLLSALRLLLGVAGQAPCCPLSAQAVKGLCPRRFRLLLVATVAISGDKAPDMYI